MESPTHILHSQSRNIDTNMALEIQKKRRSMDMLKPV